MGHRWQERDAVCPVGPCPARFRIRVKSCHRVVETARCPERVQPYQQTMHIAFLFEGAARFSPKPFERPGPDIRRQQRAFVKTGTSRTRSTEQERRHPDLECRRDAPQHAAEDMALFAFDLLANIIAARIDVAPPFSVLFTLWLSTAVRHERSLWRNNRAENSHQPTR